MQAKDEGIDTPILYASLAKTYFELGQLEEARKNAQIAIDLDAELADPYVTLSSVYGKQKANPKYVFGFAEKAYQIAPEDPDAINAFGLANMLINNYPVALQILEEGAIKFPGEYKIQYNLMLIYTLLKENDLVYRQAKVVRKIQPSVSSSIQVLLSFWGRNSPGVQLAKWLFSGISAIVLLGLMIIGLATKNYWYFSAPLLFCLTVLAGGMKLVRKKETLRGILFSILSIIMIVIILLLIFQQG